MNQILKENCEYIFYKDNIKKTILLIVDYKNIISQTYELTFHYPLIYLHNKKELNFLTINENKFNKIANQFSKVDRIILIRCKLYQTLQNICKLNIKNIYYLDDNLIIKPNHLIQDKINNNFSKEIIDNRKKFINNCDIIYVSTNYLKDEIIKYNKNIKIYANNLFCPYYKNLLNLKKKYILNEKFVIGYMGSKSHNNDLEKIKNDIIKILEEYENVYFEVAGTIKIPKIFYKNKKIKNKIKYHGSFSPYKTWLNKLNSFDWSLGLAPCSKNIFNMCKSPIKFIEYSLCNIPTLASNINFYENIIINNFNGFLVEDYNWYFYIKNIIENKNILNFILKNAQEYCEENFKLEDLCNNIMKAIN